MCVSVAVLASERRNLSVNLSRASCPLFIMYLMETFSSSVKSKTAYLVKFPATNPLSFVLAEI